eukprot:scaffold34_cov124-Isochrysis_galbana.AAC.8
MAQILLVLLTVLHLAAAFAPSDATSFRARTPAISTLRTTQIVLGRKGRPSTPGGGMMAQASQQQARRSSIPTPGMRTYGQ